MRYRKPMAQSNAIAATFAGIEAADPAALRSFQEERLRRQLSYLSQRSGFYRRRFREAGLSFELSPHDRGPRGRSVHREVRTA